MAKIKKFITNTFVQKWFVSLFSFVFILFLSFMIVTKVNSTKSLQMEYTSYSELQTERISDQLDENFRSYSRVASLLSLDSYVRIYLFNENADTLFPDIYTTISNQLYSYREGFPAIDSIYLFPASKKEFFRAGAQRPEGYSNFDDSTCLEIHEAPDKLTLIPREKDGIYPYLMSIYLPVYESGQKSLIVMNINISDISLLHENQTDSLQRIYIVSDDSQILYRSGQRDIPEPLSCVPELENFDPNTEIFSKYVSGETSYIYTQQHSGRYPWFYITVTTPQSYIGKAFNLFDAILSFLPWIILASIAIIIWLVFVTTHPIRTITDFLDNPLLELPDNISEPQTRNIIRQFVNYAQTNKSLSEELEKQLAQRNQATYYALQAQINPHFLLNTLNLIRNIEIQTLGYEHEAPEMTLTLSNLVRYALDSANLVPLQTEFYYMKLYWKVLDYRYQNKLHIEVELDDLASELLVPKLILQPLIENAVFHGCSPALESHNTVRIQAVTTDQQCTLRVQDNGIGIAPEKMAELKKLNNMTTIPSDSIGFANVIYRMYLTYGEQFHFNIESTPNEGTCIELIFPTTGTI